MSDWRKKDDFSTSSLSIGLEASNFQNYGIPNNTIFGPTNNGSQTNNSVNFEQLHSSPERLLKVMENGVGCVA